MKVLLLVLALSPSAFAVQTAQQAADAAVRAAEDVVAIANNTIEVPIESIDNCLMDVSRALTRYNPATYTPRSTIKYDGLTYTWDGRNLINQNSGATVYSSIELPKGSSTSPIANLKKAVIVHEFLKIEKIKAQTITSPEAAKALVDGLSTCQSLEVPKVKGRTQKQITTVHMTLSVADAAKRKIAEIKTAKPELFGRKPKAPMPAASKSAH